MAKIFMDFGYTPREELRFPAKKLRALRFSLPSVPIPYGGSGVNGPLPRVFISELLVDQMGHDGGVRGIKRAGGWSLQSRWSVQPAGSNPNPAHRLELPLRSNLPLGLLPICSSPLHLRHASLHQGHLYGFGYRPATEHGKPSTAQ
ncbi:hypothetical protein ACFX16_034451 [Malus domestica]